MAFTLPKLSYDYDALEPYMDARTVEIHYTKHHQAYVDKLNAAIEGSNLEHTTIEETLSSLSQIPKEIRTVVQNYGGGYANHNIFWTIMGRGGHEEPNGKLAIAIDIEFGDFNTFKEQFSQAAAAQFGSGWAWFALDTSQNLIVLNTPNHDTPLHNDNIPILCIDVWEHAYYLKYQNNRQDFIDAFWNIINWEEVERRYEEIISNGNKE